MKLQNNILWFFDDMYPLHNSAKPTTRVLCITFWWITCLPLGAISWKVPPWMSEVASAGLWLVIRKVDGHSSYELQRHNASLTEPAWAWVSYGSPGNETWKFLKEKTSWYQSPRSSGLITLSILSCVVSNWMSFIVWRRFNLKRRNLKLLYTVLLFHVHLFCAQFLTIPFVLQHADPISHDWMNLNWMNWALIASGNECSCFKFASILLLLLSPSMNPADEAYYHILWRTTINAGFFLTTRNVF